MTRFLLWLKVSRTKLLFYQLRISSGILRGFLRMIGKEGMTVYSLMNGFGLTKEQIIRPAEHVESYRQCAEIKLPMKVKDKVHQFDLCGDTQCDLECVCRCAKCVRVKGGIALLLVVIFYSGWFVKGKDYTELVGHFAEKIKES